MESAYEGGKILLSRERISEVLNESETTTEEKEKLNLVLDAREFAQGIGLTPRNSFTRYTRIDRDVLTWVVMASRKDSFSMVAWWFPFVGTVPYKGYFDKEDAIEQGKELEAKGYETWIRGADTFSSLGWFTDPVLSTTLKRDDIEIVDTVIHESVHATVWIPDHVDFNESLANAVGGEGAISYFSKKETECPETDLKCRFNNKTSEFEARRRSNREWELSHILAELYEDLSKLYNSDLTSEEKIQKREEIFANHLGPFRQKNPDFRALQKVNNAEIMQLKLYLTKIDLFQRLIAKEHGDFQAAIAEIQKIKERMEEDSTQDPFAILSTIVEDKSA